MDLATLITIRGASLAKVARTRWADVSVADFRRIGGRLETHTYPTFGSFCLPLATRLGEPRLANRSASVYGGAVDGGGRCFRSLP